MARFGPLRRTRATNAASEAGGANESDVAIADEPAPADPEHAVTEADAAPEPESESEHEPTPDTETDPAPGADPATEPTTDPATDPDAFRVGDLTAVLLFRAAHPRQALLTAVGLAVAAALSGRPLREVALVAATVLVGQVALGWFNDLVDRRRDVHHLRDKPLTDGRLDPGTLWFALAIAVFAVVPLSVGNGVHAGTAYLISLGVAVAGTWWLPLRKGFFSWAPWAVSFALYPAFLSYGGWGGQHAGLAPTVLMTLLAALLGLGVHVLTSLWGLVADNADGWTYLPLRLGLSLGTGRLLLLTAAYVVVVLAAMAVAGSTQGLSQPPLT